MFNIRVEIKIYYDESTMKRIILRKQIEEKRIVSDIIANSPKIPERQVINLKKS